MNKAKPRTRITKTRKANRDGNNSKSSKSSKGEGQKAKRMGTLEGTKVCAVDHFGENLFVSDLEFQDSTHLPSLPRLIQEQRLSVTQVA